MLAATLLAATTPATLAAQRDSTTPATRDSLAVAMRAVKVTVTRDAARSPFELPFALTSAPVSARPAQRRIGVGDLLLGVPGVQVQDRANPSQDPRVTLRGFGARSAFGVRGVRMLRDGIPLSLPDGQTPLDWLDLETVDRVDVVRGTAAALYGNAAGGVVAMRSRDPSSAPAAIETRLWDGGGLQRANIVASGTVGDTVGPLLQPRWLGSFTRTRGDGPRTWSRLDATSVFARALTTIAGTSVELQGTHYDAPRAENTGAQTAAELARDPRLPDSLNITKRSRKAVTQSQVALIAERSVGNGTARASVFTGARTLDNPLPFAIVAVDRRVSGAGLHAAWRLSALPWPVRIGGGADAQTQTDERYNYENCADVLPTAPLSTRCPTSAAERGAVRLNQQEQVQGVGGYARVEVEAPHGVYLSAALRGDAVHFRVRDRFVTATNADDSGERTLRATSPMLGLAWRPRPLWSMYANLSTAFETPTITELTNQENGAAGLNGTLEPQRTRTLEVGTQALAFGRVRGDLAVFRATVLDELVGFDVPGQAGRRAFRNAGRTTRRGVEASLRAEWDALSVGTAYTYAEYRFDRYDVGTVSYAGKPIPGIPAQYAQSFVTARHRGLFTTAEFTASARASANDAATIFGAGFTVWNWRLGYDTPAIGGVRIEPTVSVENAFDRRYASSLVLNATRNRYFEPGLPRRFSFVLRMRWR
jgi:iron complex outermembrane receptor protein